MGFAFRKLTESNVELLRSGIIKTRAGAVVWIRVALCGEKRSKCKGKK